MRGSGTTWSRIADVGQTRRSGVMTRNDTESVLLLFQSCAASRECSVTVGDMDFVRNWFVPVSTPTEKGVATESRVEALADRLFEFYANRHDEGRPKAQPKAENPMLSSAFILAASCCRLRGSHRTMLPRVRRQLCHIGSLPLARANLRAARMQSPLPAQPASSTATSFEELDASNIFDKFELIKTGASARLDLTTLLVLSPRPACFLCHLSCCPLRRRWIGTLLRRHRGRAWPDG